MRDELRALAGEVPAGDRLTGHAVAEDFPDRSRRAHLRGAADLARTALNAYELNGARMLICTGAPALKT